MRLKEAQQVNISISLSSIPKKTDINFQDSVFVIAERNVVGFMSSEARIGMEKLIYSLSGVHI